MIAEIFAGLIVGGEFHLYNFWGLFWIFMSTLICIAGIQVLVMKTSQLSLETQPKDGEEQDSDVRVSELLAEDRQPERNYSISKRYEAKLITMFTAEIEEGEGK